MNFVPAPKRIPFTDIIANVEEGTLTSEPPPDKAEELMSRVCGVLRRATPPEDNMTKEQRKELINLKKNTNLLILPADKGRATVLMKREDYEKKMRDLLDTDTYCKIKKDSTRSYVY